MSKQYKKVIKHNIKSVKMRKRENEGLVLNKMREDIRNTAFQLRYDNESITQEEADKLNGELDVVINKLLSYGYIPEDDLLIDFDNFVEGSKNYLDFCW